MSRPVPAERVTQYRAYVERLVAEARDPATSPRAALGAARAAAEAIAKHVYEVNVADPGKMMLDELLTKLAQHKLPPRVVTAMRTVQAFGNLGAHAQPDLAPTTADEVAPAHAALAIIVPWYQREVLGDEAPAAATAPPPRGRNRGLAIAGVAVAVVAAGAVITVVVVGDRAPRSPPPVTAGTGATPRQPPRASAQVVPDAAPAPEPVEPRAATPPITIDLAVWRDGKHGPRALAPGAHLVTGDRLAFEFRVSEVAHVYLLQRIGGDVDLLFPGDIVDVENPLPAGRAVRIPPDPDQWFTLVDDGTLGSSFLTIIASPVAVAELDATLLGVAETTGEVRRQKVARARDAVAQLGETPGRPDGMVTRGHLELVQPAESSRVSIRYKQRDGDPVVIATFEYIQDR